ncbi:hypothetical protein KSP39_PZI020259 [Platanthera zijinensis]|uniref:Uncharacterized protein n=1 Tax=Platanthera zijinensis TaxID=2320716 RepID=A0AAP0FX66_9ASPA
MQEICWTATSTEDSRSYINPMKACNHALERYFRGLQLLCSAQDLILAATCPKVPPKFSARRKYSKIGMVRIEL